MGQSAEKLTDKLQEEITISGCTYRLLSADFYKQIDNDINFLEQNLLEMEEKAKKISLPRVYGEFIDETHYLNSIEILFLSTAETKNGGIFLEKMVLPKIKTKCKFLEVGPGSGYFVKGIGANFESITLIDNNEGILKSLQNISSISVETIHCDFLNFYPHDRYDLILMSHILYYIDHDLWEELVIRAYKALAPGGILTIVISDGLGKAKIESFFGGHSFPMERTILNCDSILGINSEKYVSVENFLSKNRIAMQHIANILLNDAKCVADEAAVVNYLEKFCKNGSGYSIPSYQKFFIFKNET